MWSILKVFIEIVAVLFLFCFFGHEVCGIERAPLALEGEILTTGSQGSPFKKFQWSTVHVQCCVSFRSTAKWISFTYVCVHSFSRFFSHTGNYIVLSRVNHIVVVQLSLNHVRLVVTPWTIAHQSPLSMGFSRQENWSGLPFSLQGIFPTRGSNLHLVCLLLWEVGSLQLGPPGKTYFAHYIPQTNFFLG